MVEIKHAIMITVDSDNRLTPRRYQFNMFTIKVKHVSIVTIANHHLVIR